ncbi:MAG: C10 family peptidase [Bacteroidales bacterium]|nr:C10 family peptidase [Bacteroidales bacterium]
MIKRLFFAAIVLLIFALPALAKHVDVETAKAVARTFWSQNLGKQTRATFSDVTSQTEFTNFYIINADGGFVIVSADDIAHPILGYSNEGNFDPQNIPVNMRGWLLGYENEIGWGISNNVTSSEKIAAEWEKLSRGQGIPQKRSRSVNPLIQTRWNQNAPYSNFCPGFTGCVATAMAQIMKYWSYPARGIGSHTYHPTLVTVGDLSADFENTNYDWDNMLNIYTPSATQEQQDAVATLMFHCGVAVEMIYGLPSGSGAQTISYGLDEPCAENALKNFFGYKTTIQGLIRNDYTDTNWINILKAELDAGRPILYSGYDPEVDGHAFVCDGYDANEYFHFNFGWGSLEDGYYLIDAVTLGTADYSYDQEAVIGIEPDASAFDFLVVTPVCLRFEQEGGNLNFTVKSNNNVAEEWTAVSSAEWLTLSATSGEGGGAITIVTATANENISHTNRTATITVTHGSETKIISIVSKCSYNGEFFLDLSVNDSSLGYLPDFNGWWNPDYNPSIGDIYIRYYNEHLIAAHPYPHARFVDWNYYGDSIGIRTDEYCHNYISVDFEDGYELVHDTLAINATFAPVHSSDTLLYDSGQNPFRAYFGISDTATYYRWGVKFDPSALDGVTEIPQVEAYLTNDVSTTDGGGLQGVPCTYTIQLWQGGDDSPQTLLNTQSHTVQPDAALIGWQVIRFSSPVSIDSTQPLWITISCTINDGTVRLPMYESGYCGNPNSNYIWTSETGWTHYNLDEHWDFAPNSNVHSYSWAIRAYSAIPTGCHVTTEALSTGNAGVGDSYVDGGGTYDAGTSVTLTAVPDDSHCFKYWKWHTIDDPYNEHQVNDNPVTFTINSHVHYTAYFSDHATISLNSSDSNYGSVHGDGYYSEGYLPVGSSTTITAVPINSNIGFVRWEWYYNSSPSTVHQVSENPYTFTVTEDATYTAYFEVTSTVTSHITVRANNNAWGSVSGGGNYQTGETAVLRATPNSGYRFQYWMYAGYAGYTIEDNPFYITITPETSGDYTLIGYFAPLSDIDETDTDDIHIYSLDGCIIVEDAEGETVTIYDMTGRIVQDCGLPNGVYMVKVGDHPARKVVVAE